VAAYSATETKRCAATGWSNATRITGARVRRPICSEAPGDRRRQDLRAICWPHRTMGTMMMMMMMTMGN